MQQKINFLQQRKVNDAVDFIDSNYSRIDMSLNLVADTIGVNASYLSNIFKKEKDVH